MFTLEKLITSIVLLISLFLFVGTSNYADNDKKERMQRFLLQTQIMNRTTTLPNRSVMPISMPMHQQKIRSENNMIFRNNNFEEHEEHEHENHRFVRQIYFYPVYQTYPFVNDYYVTPPSDSSYVNYYPDQNAVPNETYYQPSPSAYQQYPNGYWISSSNGNVPDYAISNGGSSYYCRANYNDRMYYGELIPNEGCYVHDQSVSIQFTVYEVLVSQT